MTEKAYVFRLIGEAGTLVRTTEATARAVDDLATRTDQYAVKQARATAAALDFSKVTTSLGATGFNKPLGNVTTSLGATGWGELPKSLGSVLDNAPKVAPALSPVEQGVKSLGISAGQTANAMRQLPAQFTDIVTQLAGGQNPLLILVQQGGQIKDSFGGIGPTLTALRAALNPVTVAIGAAAVAVGFLGFAAYTGQQQLAAFNQDLLLTGNYAGVASGQVLTLSRNVATAANTTVGAARDALQSVVASGVFGPQLLEPVSTAVARLSELTGKSADKIAEEFARMGDGVAKYAAEHNKSMHLITAAQYEQIKALEDAGKAEQAQAIYIGALNARLAEHDKSIGTVGRAWQDAKKWGSEYFTWVQGTFSATTVDRQLELERAKLQNLQRANASNSGSLFGANRFGPQIAETQETIAALERSKSLAEQVAKATADSQKRQAEGIAGSQVVDEINKQIDKRSQLTKEIERYTVAVQKMRAANDPKAPNAQEEARAIELLREKYKTSDDKKAEALDRRFTDRLVALQQEGVRLDAETKSYDLYGRSIDKARVAVLDLEIAQGKLKGLDASKIKQLRDLAAADDAKDRALDQAKANAEVAKSIEVLRSQAEAKALNARESEIASRIAEIEAKGIKVGTEAYIENAASIRTWVDIKHDAILARKLAADQLQNDAEIAKLDEETRLLAASTLERQKATAALKLQAEAEKDLAANPGQTTQILDDLAARRDKLTAAIDRNYEATRRFDTGVQQSLAKYAEDTGNQAAYASRVVEGELSRAEDAIVNFSKTGKARLGDLWQFMADEFIRQQARMVISSQTQGGGILQTLLGLFGGLSVDTSGYSYNGGVGTSNAAGIAGGRAGGGQVQRGAFYQVDEKGPELFSQGGKDYLMMGGAGGFIRPLTNRDVGGRTSSNAPIVIVEDHVGANVQVKQEKGPDGEARLRLLLKEAADTAHRQVAADLASGTGRAATALRSRGVNLDGSNPKRG